MLGRRYNWRHMLTWEDSYAIALALDEQHPEIDLEEVSLQMIYCWTIALPDFEDDHDLVNDVLLQSILREWFEEVNPL